MMYATTMSLSVDSSPLELLRRYAPYILAASVGITVMASVYYKTYIGGSEIINESANSTVETYSNNGNIVQEVIAKANNDTINN